MRMLCKVKLSEHKYKTPEGYLYCKDAIIARTGKQTYLESEVFEGSTSNDYVEIDRSEKEVFSPETMASFENKPLTIEHPDVSVGPENYKDLSVGHIQNVRKGEYEGQPVMMADIMVNDAEAIRLIESGEMTELSCGYDCDITTGDNPEQINIRGNHVALCEAGRAGIAMIVDSKPWGATSVQDSVSRGTLIQEFGKQGKQYKITKIVGNVIYAENLDTEKTVLFKKDEENIEWAVITKSEVKDSMITYWKPEIGDEVQIKKLSSGLFRFKSPEEKNTFDAYVGKSGIITDITKYDENYNPIKVLVTYDNGIELECFAHELEPINNTLKRDLNTNDSEPKQYVIYLGENNGWLDINDKPVDDINEARKFTTEEEAQAHMDIYCKGTVEESVTDSCIKDRALTEEEVKEHVDLEHYLKKGDVLWCKDKSENANSQILTKAYVSVDNGKTWYSAYMEAKQPNPKDTGHRTQAGKIQFRAPQYNLGYVTPIGRNILTWYTKENKHEYNPEMHIDHINEKHTDDNPENLDIKTPQENIAKSIKYRNELKHQNNLAFAADSVSYKKEIANLLKGINYKNINDEDLMTTVEFNDKKEMRKAAKILKEKYDIELDTSDDLINVYDKLVEDEFVKDSEDWAGFDLLRGPASKDFKQYLRDRGLYFEPSSNGDYVHFEVKNADEDVYKQVDAIREHWGKFHDSYSKKFYSKMIKELEDRLKKLEKNELLDENNHVYEKQKNSMKEELKKQIEEYKQKLNNE